MTAGEGPTASDAYDDLAERYAQEVESSPYHEHLAFPATTALIPDVYSKRILDTGCGTGVYTEWLLDRGADVVGIDLSEAMLERAIERVEDRAVFHRADLGAPFDFARNGEFDGVVCALALDYVEDWRQPFAEFARVLDTGGFVVFSVPHPLDEYPPDEDENYFEVERRTKDWSVEVPYYRRPFAAMFDPLLEAGFRIDAITEPEPTSAFEEQWPERYEKESRRPVFLCVRAANEG